MSAAALSEGLRLELAQDVRDGLSRLDQKELPSKYLYDDVGSALFEAITHLDEYGLTRADERTIGRCAPRLRHYLPGPVTVVELGSGSGKKTLPVLEALGNRQPVNYLPIDVSQKALDQCRRELGDAARMVSILGEYHTGLEEAAARRPAGHTLLVLFLGSTIGNFDRLGAEEFLNQVRFRLDPGDALLLGTDLVKDEATMLVAYDDPTGVTAAFNKNLLARINRELGADFNVRQFVHESRWNGEWRRIEMHLRSLEQQTVSIPAAGMNVSFAAGETIWTEASHKYVSSELPGIARRTGFHEAARWEDREWPFADNLWIAESP